MKRILKTICVSLILATSPMAAAAQEDIAEREEDLAKQAQNPISNLISLPFQNNTNFGISDNDRTQNILNVQPVIPFKLSKDLNLITRWIIPLVSQPDIQQESGSTFGLGDINPSFFFSPDTGDMVWGFGPTFTLPTATSKKTGSGKWGAGPSVVGVYTNGPWLAGFLINNIWTFGGDGKRPDGSKMLVQPFVNFNLPDGWYLTTSPVFAADWKANADNRWSVPLGGGIGKLTVFQGFPPINFQIQGFGNVVTPDDFGPEGSLRVQVQLLFPKG